MKLFNLFKKESKPVEDVFEAMERQDSTENVREIAGRRFLVMYAVIERDTCKTIKNGFRTKQDAKDYASTLTINYMFLPYEVEI